MVVYNYTSADLRKQGRTVQLCSRQPPRHRLSLLSFPSAGRAPPSPLSPHKHDLTDFAIQPCPWKHRQRFNFPASCSARQLHRLADKATSQLCVQPGAKASSSPAKLPAAPQLLTKQRIEQTGQEQRKQSHGIRSGVKISQWPATSIMNRTDELPEPHRRETYLQKNPSSFWCNFYHSR